MSELVHGGARTGTPGKGKGLQGRADTRRTHSWLSRECAALALLLPCCGVFPLGLGFPTGTKGGPGGPMRD